MNYAIIDKYLNETKILLDLLGRSAVTAARDILIECYRNKGQTESIHRVIEHLLMYLTKQELAEHAAEY
jgi:hypothetical protein